jgi:hypothetical protein
MPRPCSPTGGLFVLAASLAPPVFAQSNLTWDGEVGNRWLVAANWSANQVPGISDTAIFDSAITPIVTLDGGTSTVGRLILSAPGQQLSNGLLTVLDRIGASGGGMRTVGLDLVVDRIDVLDSAEIRLTRSITGLGTVTGSGRLTYANGLSNAASSIQGATVQIDGNFTRLDVGSISAAGRVILSRTGLLNCGSGAALISANGPFTLQIGDASAPGFINCASVTVNAATPGEAWLRLAHTQEDYALNRFSGEPLVLLGNVGLLVDHGLRAVFAGTHGYTGETRILGGGSALELTGELTQSPVTVGAGGTLRGSGRVHRALGLQDGGELRPGINGSEDAATLRVGSISSDAAAVFRFDLASALVPSSNDRLVVDGAHTLAGRVRIDRLGTTPGVYPLIELSAPPTHALVLESLPAGFDRDEWMLRVDGNRIVLAPRGNLQLQPASLQFATTEGSVVEASTTLRNTGPGVVQVSALPPPGEVQIARLGGTCPTPPFNLALGGTCTLIYRFAPTSPGNVTTTVAVASDAVANHLVLSLGGNATQRPPELSSTMLDFGGVLVGGSTRRELTISNPSTQAQTINAIALQSGLEYAIDGSSCGATLASGGSCVVSLVLTPLVEGPALDSLRVDAASADPVAALSGTGLGARVFADGFEP